MQKSWKKKPKVLILGGCGALGREIVHILREWNSHTVYSVDSKENKDAHVCINMKDDAGLVEQEDIIIKTLQNFECEICHQEKFDAIICVAGEYYSGNLLDSSFLYNAERLIKTQLQPAIVASHLASSCLKENGCLILAGSFGQLEPHSNEITYSVCKSAIHHLLRCLQQSGSGLADGNTVIGVLPNYLDTEQNRQKIPQTEHHRFTKIRTLADKIVHWATRKENFSLKSGFVSVSTEQGKTNFTTFESKSISIS